MSRTKKLAIASMITAACFALLYLASAIGQVRLAVTALAGLFPAVVVMTGGSGWALASFAATGILGLLLLPDKSPALWFLFFFGHYPVWKSLIERLQNRRGKPIIGWVLKLLGFSLCMTLFYLLFRDLFFAAIPSEASKWVIGLLVPALLVCFIAYDIAFSILIGFFRSRILPRIK